MRNSVFIKIHAVPLLQQIEQSDRKSEPHLEIRPDSLPQMFQFANLREQRKNGFDQHSVVPGSAPTDFQVFRLTRFAPKTSVRQNNHFAAHLFNQRQKLLVGNIRRFNIPSGNQSKLVGQQTEFTADNPFPGSKTFASDSVSMRLMVFTDRVTQLNAVRVNDTEERRVGEKRFSQFLMCFQSAKESGAFRQTGKKVVPILSEPPIESVLRRAFQSKQQAQSDKFTDRKFSLDVFVRFRQHIIYTAKKFYDKVFLSHAIGFLCVVFGHLHNRNFSVTFSTSTNG
jgi:hypothetical protein